MSILNSKTRIFDTIITQEGRRQLASGEFRAKYYSFTDAGATYKQDTIVSGGLDETYRIHFEATNQPQDSITLESNDSGLVNAFAISDSDGFVIRQGQILSSSFGSLRQPVTGQQFASLATTLLSSSIDNFKNLYIIKSSDPLDDPNIDKSFLIGPSKKTFTITDNGPIKSNELKEANINEIESLFFDKRLSHVPNFMFLPPVNKSKNSLPNTPLGTYVSLNQEPITTFKQLEQELNEIELRGFSETVRFTNTSRQNNVFCQMFELSNNQTLTKLDVIDFGEFPGSNSEQSSKHVFFVGKVYRDNTNTDTFVNLFTLVFE